MNDDDLPMIRYGTRDPKVDGPLEIGPDPYNPDWGSHLQGRVVSRLNPEAYSCPTTKRTVTGKKKKQPAAARHRGGARRASGAGHRRPSFRVRVRWRVGSSRGRV